MSLDILARLAQACPDAEIDGAGQILVALDGRIRPLLETVAPGRTTLGVAYHPSGLPVDFGTRPPDTLVDQDILGARSGNTWIYAGNTGWSTDREAVSPAAQISLVQQTTLDTVLRRRALDPSRFRSLMVTGVPGDVAELLTGADGLLDHLSVIVLEKGMRAATPVGSLLFDRGFLKLREEAFDVYMRSAFIPEPGMLAPGGPDCVTMGEFGTQGRFGNQLFQYLHLTFYALRREARMLSPPWAGDGFFSLGLSEQGERPPALPLTQCFSNEPDLLEFWRDPNAPTNVDFQGYYQVLPPTLRQHRAMVRRLFSVKPHLAAPLDAWLDSLYKDAKTRVVIHVRRGDYEEAGKTIPMFRLTPEDWYLRFLDAIWSHLDRPALFVATDAPETVLPHFAHFGPVNDAPYPDLGPGNAYLVDFYAMMRGDVLCTANSSFSRMAALLNPSERIYAPSFQEQRIRRFFPWSDVLFWDEFSPLKKDMIAWRRQKMAGFRGCWPEQAPTPPRD